MNDPKIAFRIHTVQRRFEPYVSVKNVPSGMKPCISLFVLMILVACQQPSISSTATGPTSQAVTETVTSIPVPGETIASLPSFTQSLIPTPVPVIYRDMDEADEWQVYAEGNPKWSLQNVATPSFDGKALRCAILGGEPYSNVHCYRNLASLPDAEKFSLALLFWFSPTTCNNQGNTSLVQALEFTMSKWYKSRRYEFALQWQNVGEGAPQWRYWNPESDDKWMSIASLPPDCLESAKWHEFIMHGEILSDQVHLLDFSIDEKIHPLDLMIPSVATPGEVDRLAVAVQLDGNASQSPYALWVDDVIFSAQSPTP